MKISKIAFGGEGIASVEGKTCFVSGALPGETVIARVTEEKKNFLRAKTIKVIEASRARVEPPCPYVDFCGGCQYQHASYQAELMIKESQVREALSRALGAPGDLVRPIRHGARDYRYRNNVTLHRTSKEEAKPQPLGFVSRDNKTRLVVSDCLLTDERLLPAFRAGVRLKKGQDRVTFRLSGQGEIITDLEDRFLRVNVGGQELITSSRGFFQNNLEVTALLAEQIRQWAEPVFPETFYDVYSGAGTFAFLSAPEAASVHCVEESPESLQALRMNRAEKKKSLEITEGRAEKAFPLVYSRRKRGSAHFICLDPPRAGLEASLVEYLAAESDAAAIAYVSCDPATLTRDLAKLVSRGRYSLVEAVPFDMFPRTKHIEVAVLLRLNPSPIV